MTFQCRFNGFLTPLLLPYNFSTTVSLIAWNTLFLQINKTNEAQIMDDFSKYYDQFVDWAVYFAPKLLMAIAILVIGFWLIKKIGKVVNLSLEKAKMTPEVNSFLSSLLDMVMKLAVLLVAASMIGFEMSSLVAVLAAAGFAVGLALQGNLSNFAAGITVMVFKPYKLGDWVELGERFGKVESIQIFNTTIVTPGRKVHIIPNGQVVSGVITNYSEKGQIHLELEVPMPYEESFPKVKKIILEALQEVPEIFTRSQTYYRDSNL